MVFQKFLNKETYSLKQTGISTWFTIKKEVIVDCLRKRKLSDTFGFCDSQSIWRITWSVNGKNVLL